MLISDRSAPHAPYFAELNQLLRTQWPGKPALVVDLDRLDRNLTRIRARINPAHSLRIVAKSLPGNELLRYVLSKANSHELMVFDTDSARQLLPLDPKYRLMLGKPMPLKALEAFCRSDRAELARIHWLIDSAERLQQYSAHARAMSVELNVVLEIDVGLHRGGIAAGEHLQSVLEPLRGSPLHLTGLMGYEVHIASAQSAGHDADHESARVQARYTAFVQQLREQFPDLAAACRIFHCAGSKTYQRYCDSKVVNDIAVGSALLKPTQDDLPQLAELEPAAFIGAPVLKVLPGSPIPYLEWARNLLPHWNPNRATTLYLFGGGWLANYESPSGLTPLPLMGFSTNQAHVNIGRHSGLQPDDYVFLRPTQSEKVLTEFDGMLAVRAGRIEAHWTSW